MVDGASGETEDPSVELFSYLSTLGGISAGLNVTKMGIVKSDCSRPLSDDFSASHLFDGDETSSPFVSIIENDRLGKVWVGAEFLGFSFIPTRIEVKLVEKRIDVKVGSYFRIRIWNERDVESGLQMVLSTERKLVFESQQNVIQLKRFRVEMQPISERIPIAVLRVHSIKIFGRFK
jgi:hypothetical protein